MVYICSEFLIIFLRSTELTLLLLLLSLLLLLLLLLISQLDYSSQLISSHLITSRLT